MILAALVFWRFASAPALAAAAPDPCAAYAADERAACLRLAALLPEIEAVWAKPYELPSRLPGIRKNWDGLGDLSPAAVAKLPAALREQWTAVADSLAKFPDADQYRALEALARADAPELRAALKARRTAWDPTEAGGAGAFVALDESGKAAGLAEPDTLKALVADAARGSKKPAAAVAATNDRAAPPSGSAPDAAALSRLFDASGGGAAGDPTRPAGTAPASRAPRESAPAAAPKAAAAAAEPTPPQPAPAVAAAEPDSAPLAALKAQESALRALVASGVPVSFAANLARVERDIRRLEASRDSGAWLKANGLDPDAPQAAVEAALDASPSGKKEAAALARLAAARGGPPEALDAAAAELARAQREILKDDPGYYRARGAWAALVAHNRETLPDCADGTVFRPEELGLPPESAPGGITKTTVKDRDGNPLGGYAFASKDGTTHFRSFDGMVRRDELKSGDAKPIYIESDDRDPSGRSVTAFYDENQVKTAATVMTPLGKGLFEMADEAKPWPKTRGRFIDGQFSPERVDEENGAHRVLDRKTGIWKSWTNENENLLPDSQSIDDARALGGIKDPKARRAAIDAVAAAFIRGRFPTKETASPGQFRYESDSVAAMLDDYLRSAQGSARIVFTRDAQVVIDEYGADGALLRQFAGEFEKTLSGRGDGGAHEVPQGLTVSVRNAYGSQDAQFCRVGQYLGAWGREEVRSRTDSNASSLSSWFTGVTVTQNSSVVRFTRRRDGTFAEDGAATELPPEEIYSGVGIVGAVRDASATVGKGTVNLIGAGVSIGLASSPLYAAVVYATGGDGEAARRDLLERAKANFFQNAVSQELGRIYVGDGYQEAMKDLGIDSTKNVQNVGAEMKDLGHEGAGAILQGGVNFANSQFNPEQYLMIKGLGSLSGGALGSAGKLAAAGLSAKMTAEAGYGLGTAINRMRDAALMYDERDPASREAYYEALRDVTEQGLGAPMLFGGLDEAFRGGAKGAAARETAARERAAAPAEPGAAPKEPGPAGRALGSVDGAIARALDSTPFGIGRWLARETRITLPEKPAPAGSVAEAASPEAAQAPAGTVSARGPPVGSAAPRRSLDEFVGAAEARKLRDGQLRPGDDLVVQMRDAPDGGQVVVKYEKGEGTREADIQHRAAAIARAMKSELPSVSVPDVLGVDARADGKAIFAMEKAPGRGLDEILADPAAPKIPAAKWEQFKAFMSELHRGEIAHGDLKAHNILIDAQGGIHLIDFDRAVEGEAAIRATKREIFDADGKPIQADPIRTDEIELAALEAKLREQGRIDETPAVPPGGALDLMKRYWRGAKDYLLPPADAARTAYEGALAKDRSGQPQDRIADVVGEMRSADESLGQLDLSPTKVQTMSDCQIRALYNHPDMAPLRRALTYDEVLDLAHRVGNSPIEDKGTHRGTLAQILSELGYDLSEDQPLFSAFKLAVQIEHNGGQFTQISWKVKRGPQAAHAIVLTAAYRRGTDWTFVAVDSNMRGPVTYSFAELQALGAVTYQPRARKIDGRVPTDAQLAALAAEARRRYAASGVAAKSLDAKNVRPVRSGGVEPSRTTEALSQTWRAVGAGREGAMTIAQIDPGAPSPLATWEVAREGGVTVVRQGTTEIARVAPNQELNFGNIWGVRGDGIAEFRVKNAFSKVDASYALNVPKPPVPVVAAAPAAAPVPAAAPAQP